MPTNSSNGLRWILLQTRQQQKPSFTKTKPISRNPHQFKYLAGCQHPASLPMLRSGALAAAQGEIIPDRHLAGGGPRGVERAAVAEHRFFHLLGDDRAYFAEVLPNLACADPFQTPLREPTPAEAATKGFQRCCRKGPRALAHCPKVWERRVRGSVAIPDY
jgi:hypothetical protein